MAGSASVVMESFHHIFITAAISIFILTLLCAFIFRLIRCWRSKSSYELAAAVIQNKQFPQPEFYNQLKKRDEEPSVRDILLRELFVAAKVVKKIAKRG
uniref:Uncharacterized protein n=1 Tax=Wuchereria bancrofti TaxID=6293 RepID=A0AAF5PZA7_WUCBA